MYMGQERTEEGQFGHRASVKGKDRHLQMTLTICHATQVLTDMSKNYETNNHWTLYDITFRKIPKFFTKVFLKEIFKVNHIQHLW